MLFDYPAAPHVRLHSPGGYRDYGTYKDWLRDEFKFRCVYCLYREMFWPPNGEKQFGADHVENKDDHPELECVYSNLVYACNGCNSFKQKDRLIDPCSTAFAQHLGILPNGKIEALSTEGNRLIKKLKLDSPQHDAFRAHMLKFYRIYQENPDSETAQMVRFYLGYPNPLPDLSLMKPPENPNEAAIEQSHLKRQQRGELEETY